MRDAALEAVEMADGHERADLDSDKLLERALRYQVIMIGEAASSLADVTRNRAPDIPWGDIIGMRDRSASGGRDAQPMSSSTDTT